MIVANDNEPVARQRHRLLTKLKRLLRRSRSKAPYDLIAILEKRRAEKIAENAKASSAKLGD